jgi:hypothetical protein
MFLKSVLTNKRGKRNEMNIQFEIKFTSLVSIKCKKDDFFGPFS